MQRGDRQVRACGGEQDVSGHQDRLGFQASGSLEWKTKSNQRCSAAGIGSGLPVVVYLNLLVQIIHVCVIVRMLFVERVRKIEKGKLQYDDTFCQIFLKVIVAHVSLLCFRGHVLTESHLVVKSPPSPEAPRRSQSLQRSPVHPSEVPSEEAKELADELGLRYLETSAKHAQLSGQRSDKPLMMRQFSSSLL